jgi:rhomboid family GlyGly-CTERM serine protease
MAAAKAVFIDARWRFASAVSLVALLLLICPQAPDLLMWERSAITDGELWRWMTAHLVHLSLMHGLSNLLGLLLICEYLWDELALADACALLLWTAAGTSLLLWWFAPEIDWYAGLSGVLHGLWAGCALAWFCRSGDRVAAAALALLAIKLALPTYGLSALPVVTVAHGYGALCGLIWAVSRARTRRHGFFG